MFDENKLKNNLISLSFEKQLVFAASCCERLLPFYFAFRKVENWGDHGSLRAVLDKIWEIARTKQISKEEVFDLSKQVDSVVPDSEDFSSPYTFQAQNACAAICNSLEFCLTNDISLLVDIARDSFEAVEMYLNMVNDPILDTHGADPKFDEWIQKSPLLLSKIEDQQETIKLLSESETSHILLEKVRQESSISGVQPEKRGLL